MIIHIQKRENPYVQIDKTCLEDPRLSWKAKGILAYLLSKPPDWKVRSEDVIKKSTDGRDAVKAAMAELKQFGYASLHKVMTESGEFAGQEWTINETPKLPNQAQVLENSGATENPSLPERLETRSLREPGVSGKPAPSNNDSTDNQLTKNEGEQSSLFKDLENTKKKNFIVPSEEEVYEYLSEQGMPSSDAEREAAAFIDHHEAKGWWMSKGVKMSNWRSAANIWKRHWEKPARRYSAPEVDRGGGVKLARLECVRVTL